MVDGAEGEGALAPKDAFKVLGNETRLAILQVLAAAEGPLTFTEVRREVGLRQGTQFNYHLTKLVGHFVEKTDAGYALREPGRRVVEAVLSGAVTDSPELPLTPVPPETWVCPYCGGTVEVGYEDGRVRRRCTECPGYWHGQDDGSLDDSLGTLSLPAAGVEGRDASGVLDAALVWGYAQFLMGSRGVCPRCSATVEAEPLVCDDHDTSEGRCPTCGGRELVRFRMQCTNCHFVSESIFSMYLAGETALHRFMLDHGYDLLGTSWDWGWEYDEEVLSRDPFAARFTFTIDDETLTVTVDETLSVVEAVRGTVGDD